MTLASDFNKGHLLTDINNQNLMPLGKTFKPSDGLPKAFSEIADWVQNSVQVDTPKFNGDNYWFAIHIHNDSFKQNWVLYPYGTAVDNIDIYLVSKSNLNVFKTGYQREHEFMYHYGNSLALTPGESYYLLINFKSDYFFAPIRLLLKEKPLFENQIKFENSLILLCFGVGLALGFYNLFIYLGTRQSMYLYYSAFVFSWIWGWGHTLNLPEEWFGIRTPEYLMVGFLLLPIFNTLFFLKFLKIDANKHKSLRYSALAFGYLGLAGIPIAMMSPGWGVILASITTGGMLLTGFILGVISLRQGFKPAKYFLLAYMMLLAPNMVGNLMNLGIIPSMNVNIYLLGLIGSTLDALFLAFAMADKVRLLNEENIALNSNLERKVSERTAELQKTSSELERANESKSRFLAQMSHEIRTPMNAVIGLSQLALKTNLNFEQRDYLQKIYHSGDVLLGIINDILDYSKIEAGKLNIEKVSFNLERVIERATNICSLKAHAKGLELIVDIKPDVPKFIESDPLRIQQVLVNLISNSVKFTEHGHVNIRISAKSLEDDEFLIEFAVVDTGMGMTEQQQKSLFKPFSQADDSITRKFGGTGLGLAISKQLVELMGGDIWVNSKEGLGSAFHFSVNCKKTHEDISTSAITIENRRLRVLIVDDNAIARRVILDMFVHHSADVVEAENGIQAIDKVQEAIKNQQKFDLIVMDWRMPEMDGIQASKLIRQDLGVKDMPAILMVSAYDKDEAKAASEGVGINGFIEKPVSQSTLFDTLQTCLNIDIKQSVIPESPWSEQSVDLSHLNILLVEDNKLNRQVAVGFLKEANIQIDIAENGIQAIDKVMKNDYDLVLMDIQMPEMDGLTATREIRSLPKFEKLPIIAMTAHAMAGDSKKSLSAGMNDHLTKPVDPDELYRVIYKWVDKTNAHATKNAQSGEVSASSELSELQSLSLLDVSNALKQMQGRTALYLDLIKTFVEENQHTRQELEVADNKDDTEQLYLKVHSLKSNAAYIGAQELANAAAQLEQAITNQQDYQALLAKTCNKLNSLMEQLDPFAQQFFKQDIDIGSFTQVEVEQLLKQITELLEESNADVEDFIPKLEQLQYHVENGNMIVKLIEYIDDIEYDDALALIRENRQVFELST
ncbi:response regulator [Catenovulum agarivorans]|uniref:response regulator n=1 Tax=Catenovulum agarivorans TaxID=1172192 RepID=UPI001363AA1A|nr:response regulator [Catenovulum agarivorans]